MRKGEFSRPKASGKRAIELGAGIGLAGLAFALIGGQ
jgi:tRNA1(Val) A37 N6-methylase TrmN6